MADVKFTEKAIDQLDSLEDDTSDRIQRKLEEIEDWPGHFLERLQGYPYYKLRVGDYRVIIDWKRGKEILHVLTLGHRRNIYK